ncbi:ABC transporter permease [Candidatus Saccharibacteria bacterium]|nr:ABC transporter permease [Candidatus Saccharibacteria bacterium]
MKLADILRRSGRSLKSAKMRTFLTATAIAVGGFTLIITLAASNGARSYVDKILQENFDPAELYVYKDKAVFGEEDKTTPKEYSESGALGTVAGNGGNITSVKLLSQEDLAQLEALDFTQEVTPVVQLSPEYVTREGQGKYIATFQQLGSRRGITVVAGTDTVAQGKKQLILPEPFVKSLGFSSNEDAVGKTVVVAVRAQSQPTEAEVQALLQQTAAGAVQSAAQARSEGITETEFTVVGVRKNTVSQQPGTDFALYTSNENLLALHDIVYAGQPAYRSHSTAIVLVKDGDNEKNILAAQAELKDLGFESKSSKDLQKLINNFISTLQIIIVVFSVITVIASIFGIVNTLYISVLERTREIGLMKALGMRRRSVNLLFIFEALWIGFIGGVMGVLAGYAFGTLVNPFINKQLELGEGVSLLEFKPEQMIMLVGALMIIAMLAGLLPARKASKLDPIEALRTE